ncbi:MAG: HAD hydrolase family protein, partial [Candidatus Heimdallarchaeota archaeon]
DNEHKIRTLREQIYQETPNVVQMSKSFDSYLEISPPGVTKCVFLPEILKLYFIKKTKKKSLNTLFIGDSDNDVPCAKVVDESWTFKSSPENLKSLSKGIIADENGKGVRKFLQQFL